MATHQKRHNKRSNETSELSLAGTGTCYGKVTAANGACRFTVVRTRDSKEYNVGLRGKMHGRGGYRNRIEVGCLVLLELDSCTTTKENYNIVHKYSNDHAKSLEQMGELKTVKSTDDDMLATIVFERDAALAPTSFFDTEASLDTEADKARTQAAYQKFIDDI